MINDNSTEPENEIATSSDDATTHKEVDSNDNIDNSNNSNNNDVDIFELSDEEFESKADELVNSAKENNDATSSKKDDDTKSDDDSDADLDLDTKYKSQLDAGFELTEPILIKVDGSVMEISDSKDARALIEKGLNYTKKTQELAQHRKTLMFLENNGINNVDDLEKVLNGELQLNEPVKPIDDASVNAEHIESVANNILNSDKADEMKMLISSMPLKAKQILESDANVLDGLFYDLNQGLAQKIMPLANKYMTVNDMSFEEAYIKAGNEISNADKTDSVKRNIISSEPKSRGTTQKRSYTRDDIFSMDESEFEKYVSKL